jgi:hypothetical protein
VEASRTEVAKGGDSATPGTMENEFGFQSEVEYYVKLISIREKTTPLDNDLANTCVQKAPFLAALFHLQVFPGLLLLEVSRHRTKFSKQTILPSSQDRTAILEAAVVGMCFRDEPRKYRGPQPGSTCCSLKLIS